MTNLFTISSTDLTKWEDTTKHKVNRDDVYTTWTDGNWIDHREIVRTRVTGTVVLRFSKEADFASFMSLMTSARDANGYYSVTVWCSNTNSVEMVNVFLDIAGETKWDVTCPRKFHEITVTITGR